MPRNLSGPRSTSPGRLWISRRSFVNNHGLILREKGGECERLLASKSIEAKGGLRSAMNDTIESNVTLMRFGQARVMVNTDSRLELVGGNNHERSEALEWLGMFLTPHQCATLEDSGAPVPYELLSIATI